MTILPRNLFGLLCFLPALALWGCGTPANHDPARTPVVTAKETPRVDLLKNEIPPSQLDEVLRAHFQGLGFMERYEYRQATKAFREVNDRAPGWIPGSINLAIALLNDTGAQAEDQKGRGGAEVQTGFDKALSLLDSVLARDAGNLSAHYCRGLILEFLGQGRTAEAHADFLFVADHDPADGHAWFKVGATLTAPGNPGQPAGPDQAEKLVELYARALDRNPYLVPALYKLQQASGWAGRRDRQKELLDRWRQLNPKTNPAGPGETAESFYGESGKYARIINPFPAAKAAETPGAPPRFDPPSTIKVRLPEGDRWVVSVDFRPRPGTIGLDTFRNRFGATIATFDADGDGRADLFLAAAITGPKGVRDAILINKGDNTFEDVSRSWGLPDDQPSVGAAAADFDADRRIDLFLTGPKGYRLYRNLGSRFEDVTEKVGMDKARALGVTARWLDLDQDGDLDLYVVNYTDLDHVGTTNGQGAPLVRNAAFRNNGKPASVSGRPEDNWAPIAVAPSDLAAKAGLSLAFEPWPDAEALTGPPGNYTSIAALDIDDDRDLDLILAADRALPLAVLNDRLGKFHASEISEMAIGDSGSKSAAAGGLLVADLDKDGRADVVAIGSGGNVRAWRNTTEVDKSPRVISWKSMPADLRTWRVGIATDLDLDTWPDLLGLPTRDDNPLVDWARNDGEKLTRHELSASTEDTPGLSGLAIADVAGDPLPDLILLADGHPPQVARNLGNGAHWLALDLGGRWKTSFDHMRTNPHGIGTRVTVEGQGLLVTYDHTTPSTGLGQSVGPVVLGLGKSLSAELVRLRWPDGTMQCELNQKADVVVKLAETNRKTGSCPVLFTWNGDRFVCLGDFLGGGGLGYLVAPGVYSQPDRDESVAIAPDQLKAVDGVLRLSVTEPMDEVAYLDRLELVVVDRPPGVSSTPDERFAPDGPRPSGQVIAWTTSVAPVRASDLKGRDATEALRSWDRTTIKGVRRLDGWVGYAEEHGLVLDFGDRLSQFGPRDRLVLALAGWVEYPYSQTNYAASTAGVVLRAPVVERLGAGGQWVEIAGSTGYPAGLPRMTTLDLTGKLNGPNCVLRLRTNMECYWDQAFVALRDSGAESSLRQTTLTVARAVLGHRGYSREVSPDGRDPLVYDYDHVDPAPLALMSGRLTRYGDVRSLLLDDDDHLCLVGPGDEVRLEYDAKALGELPKGWTRGYVLKAVGYCKDADPLTAGSDSVEPLPWRAMPSYPFPPGTSRPVDPAYQTYLDDYQTRPAGAR